MSDPVIHVGMIDKYSPDVQAMITAKYSRSYAPVADRLPDTSESEDKHRESLHKYYIGYGHKSVSQLGSTTIFLEGISMLAEKAVQNNPLYNGQSSSTRYIDFTNQPMVVPDSAIAEWQEKFRALYVEALPLVVEKIKLEFPFDDNHGEYLEAPVTMTETEANNFLIDQNRKKLTTWENTIKARAFDICRGLLPAGCTTNVAFTGTFDTINDHFGEMLFHPCKEMRDIAVTVLTQLKEKYSYAAMDISTLKERNSFVNNTFFYQILSIDNTARVFVDKYSTYSNINMEVAVMLSNLKDRKKFSKINRVQSKSINVTLQGELDFGSYRDIHRHRNGVIGMEVLGVERGFHEFYFNNLPAVMQDKLNGLLDEYTKWYAHAGYLTNTDKQYSVPMGFKVAVDYSCDFNQALYIMELRSGKTVHQTLRHLIQDWVCCFNTVIRNTNTSYQPKACVTIHADMETDNFSLRRGQQTFNV